MFLDLAQFSEEANNSLAILVAKSPHGNHAGILVKEEDVVKLYHLSWHLLFRCEDPMNLIRFEYYKFQWVRFAIFDSALDPDRDRTEPVIRRLKTFHETNSKKDSKSINYGLNYSETLIDELDNVIYGEGEHGLTCATFIACFFKSIGYELIDLNSWQSRIPEDENWKQEIIEFMRETDVPQEHIEKIINEDFNKRVKPEEIAVASSQDPLPANFVFCSVAGAQFNL